METVKLLDEYDRPLFELDHDSIPQCQINTMMDALLKDMREYFFAARRRSGIPRMAKKQFKPALAIALSTREGLTHGQHIKTIPPARRSV